MIVHWLAREFGFSTVFLGLIPKDLCIAADILDEQDAFSFLLFNDIYPNPCKTGEISIC